MEVSIMAENKLKIGKVQVVLFRSSRRVTMMLAIVLGFTVIALGALCFVDHCMVAKTEELRSQAAQIEYENQVLSHNIADLGSAKSVERIAQQELGLVPKDAILIEAQVK